MDMLIGTCFRRRRTAGFACTCLHRTKHCGVQPKDPPRRAPMPSQPSVARPRLTFPLLPSPLPLPTQRPHSSPPHTLLPFNPPAPPLRPPPPPLRAPATFSLRLPLAQSPVVANRWRKLDLTFILVLNTCATYALSYFTFGLWLSLAWTAVVAVAAGMGISSVQVGGCVAGVEEVVGGALTVAVLVVEVEVLWGGGGCGRGRG